MLFGVVDAWTGWLTGILGNVVFVMLVCKSSRLCLSARVLLSSLCLSLVFVVLQLSVCCVCLFICFVYLFIYLFVYLCVCLVICLFICLFIYLFIYVFVYLCLFV